MYFFLFLPKKISCGYSLEVPHWDTSNECPCFHGEIKKKKKILSGYPLLPIGCVLDQLLRPRSSLIYFFLQSLPEKLWKLFLNKNIPFFFCFVLFCFVLCVCVCVCFSPRGNNCWGSLKICLESKNLINKLPKWLTWWNDPPALVGPFITIGNVTSTLLLSLILFTTFAWDEVVDDTDNDVITLLLFVALADDGVLDSVTQLFVNKLLINGAGGIEGFPIEFAETEFTTEVLFDVGKLFTNKLLDTWFNIFDWLFDSVKQRKTLDTARQSLSIFK